MRVKLSEYIYIYTYGFCIVKIIIIIILVQLCILCIYACSFDWLLQFEQAAFVVCPNVSGIVSWLVLIEVACKYYIWEQGSPTTIQRYRLLIQ